MAARVKRDHFSGSILIAREGKVLFSKGYGLASVEHDVPNTPHTKYRLGSITKQFTAMGAAVRRAPRAQGGQARPGDL